MISALVRALVLGSAFVSVGGLAATARGDGLPVIGVNTASQGVVATRGGDRYIALPARRGTVVARVDREGGRVRRSAYVEGRFAVPAVAYDGSASGLSADEQTLVLIRPRARFPQAETRLAVLSAARLRVRDFVTLPGDFSFDGISPGGSMLYLIQYTSRVDPNRYRVRAYDVRARRLLSAPIVDPRERGEAMRGSPITRATSPDGRWAYTLYDGAGKAPFVHALDLSRHTARCIDLDALAGRNAYNLGLGVDPGGRTLTVLADRKPVAIVDTRTFRVTEPGASPASTGKGGDPWVYLAAAVGALGLAGVSAVAVWRRRLARLAARTEVVDAST